MNATLYIRENGTIRSRSAGACRSARLPPPGWRQPGRRIFQPAAQFVRGYAVMDRLNIDEQRRRPGHFDRGDRGDGGVRQGHLRAAGTGARATQARAMASVPLPMACGRPSQAACLA